MLLDIIMYKIIIIYIYIIINHHSRAHTNVSLLLLLFIIILSSRLQMQCSVSQKNHFLRSREGTLITERVIRASRKLTSRMYCTVVADVLSTVLDFTIEER